jgi:hypothetical protein
MVVPQLDKFTYFTQFFWSCLFLFFISIFFHYLPLGLQVRLFFSYITKPQLQRALSLVKGSIFLFIFVRYSLTIYNLYSVLFDILVSPVLPTTSHSSGGSNSIVGVGSHEGSSSGWTSFDLDVLGEEEEEVAHPLPNPLAYPGGAPEPQAGAPENQQPFIPELEPPLLDDNTRLRDLNLRLRANWLGYVYDETHVDSFVQTQLPIEKHIEAALVEDGYARQSVLEKIDQIRGFLFYPEGKALYLKTYRNHLNQIETFGTRNSIPYRQVRRALHYYHLFLER